MEENPNYYAIIPAEIRYDKDLSDKAKLLYGEISALSNRTGECWASNKYFADLYGITTIHISRIINELKEKKYIDVELMYKTHTRQIEKRIIKLNDAPIKEMLIPINKNVNTPINKNVKENNTSINNTSMNNNIYMGEIKNFTDTKKFKVPTLEEVKNYCTERNNGIDAEQFIDFYSSKGWMVGKNKMKDWRASIRTWERSRKQKSDSSIKNYAEDIGLKVETKNGVTGIWKI